MADRPAERKRDERAEKGGTMRLGAQEIRLRRAATRPRLRQGLIFERHRHRYEFNNTYLERYRGGSAVSGFSPDGLVEIVELPGHPWFVAIQFHPEFTSTPRDSHPLFTGFIRAARGYRNRRAAPRRPRRHAAGGVEIGVDQGLFLIAGPCVSRARPQARWPNG